MPKRRLVIVDILTLMATVLVVMGHHKFLREIVSWYPVYDRIIYSFHMGFFMTISGFLVRYTFPLNCNWVEYIGKKVRKFVPAYFTVGLLAALLSFKTINGLTKDMIMMIVKPTEGPIQIIWYIYVLLVYYCLSPFIFQLSTRYRLCLFFISLIPSIFNPYIPTWFCLRPFCRLLPFFLLGTHLADNHENIKNIPDGIVLLSSLPFLLFLIACILMNKNPLNWLGLGKLVPSALSLPLMYYMARKFELTGQFFILFSPYVFSVFLWQMFFINFIWLVWNKVGLPMNDIIAIFYLLLSVVVTIIGIVLMEKSYRWAIGKLLKNKPNGKWRTDN